MPPNTVKVARPSPFGNYAGPTKKDFDDDLANSQPVTLDEWQRRGPLPRLQEALAKMWEYWL